MFTSETEHPRPNLASAVRRLLQFVITTVTAFVRAVAHRSEVRQLLELDDRSLKDIGLVRTDVIGALDQGLATDPSLILTVRAVDRRRRLRARPASARSVVEPSHVAA